MNSAALVRLIRMSRSRRVRLTPNWEVLNDLIRLSHYLEVVHLTAGQISRKRPFTCIKSSLRYADRSVSWVTRMLRLLYFQILLLAMKRANRKYVPTPDEIREACQRIRDRWSHEEKQRRQLNSRNADDSSDEEELDNPSS